jgi:hypothetical protein
MSTNNDLITRRTVFVTAAGAACTLLMPPARADDELPQRRGPYRIEDWGKTWLNPNKARVLARVPAIAMPDIAGYWPRTTRPVRGPQEYFRSTSTRILSGKPPRAMWSAAMPLGLYRMTPPARHQGRLFR